MLAVACGVGEDAPLKTDEFKAVKEQKMNNMIARADILII